MQEQRSTFLYRDAQPLKQKIKNSGAERISINDTASFQTNRNEARL
jgi:hypothetical protein